MNKGELYLEQVFVGALVIAAVALPFLPEVLSLLADVEGLGSFVTGSIALGIAFLVGVPFDRLADTLTDRLDHHARLRFALKAAAGEVLAVKPGSRRLSTDYFPENRLRLNALREGADVNAFMDYHRSRVRLARSMAVYGPALLLALLVGLHRHWFGVDAYAAGGALAVIAICYWVWHRRADDSRDTLPRTDDEGLIQYAQTRGLIDERNGAVKPGADERDWRSDCTTCWVPAIMLLLALGIAGWSAWTGFHDPLKAVLPPCIAVGGTAVVLLSVSTWMRITKTYRSYLLDIAG